jgi:hypothetical protein
MRLPTVRPTVKPRKEEKKESKSVDFVKPIATTMNRMFPSVDKLCDAPFIKKITGLGTKKAALLFIAENSMVYNFFNQMEVKMRENNVYIKKDIEQYFQTKEVLVAVSAFKIQIKQIEAEQKVMKKKQEEQAIIEEARERIAQEEKNRLIAEYLQEQAHAAKMRGDEKAAQDFSIKAMKLMEEQKKRDEKGIKESTDSTESGDSGDSDNDSDEDYVEESNDESSDSSTANSANSTISNTNTKNKTSSENSTNMASSPKNSKSSKPEPVANATAATIENKTAVDSVKDDQLDIKRVIEIINATNEAGYLTCKHGNKEFKIVNLVLDRVNAKLVLNIEPTLPEKSPVKVNFD